MHRLILSLLVFGTIGCASSALPINSFAQRPSSPPRICEIRHSAWCIDREVSEIIDKPARYLNYDRAWMLQDDLELESVLVVLEPNGCRSGFSDIFVMSNYEKDFEWDGQRWDRIQVRLKKDGSCDLGVLIAPYEGGDIGWAFSTALILVRNCVNADCSGGHNIGELKQEFESKYMRKVP